MTKIGLVQLGCPKNYVDGEEMLGALMGERPGSCEIVGCAEDADVLIVNTCAFIDRAKQESVDAILDAVRLKERGKVGRVVVTGCLAQRYGGDLRREIPEVDAFLGIESGDRIGNVVFGAPRSGTDQQTVSLSALDVRYPLIPNPRLRAGAQPWTAYLKISEGCDHQCTFCSIPSFRGRHRSKPIERLVAEAADLAAKGAREIILIAQDTTAYGIDLYRELKLPDLLAQLAAVDGLDWIRLLYCYPTMVTARLIETIAAEPKVLPYIDMPLQHADDGVLRAMKRGGGRDHYLRLFERMRAAIPDLALRTTFIVGFPGETQAAFERLEQFAAEVQFDKVGVFEYSPEENTPAGAMPKEMAVPRSEARERRRRLMSAQSGISEARNRQMVGRALDVLIESRSDDGDWVGRSYRDAPEIDGSVIVRHAGHEGESLAGRFVSAKITSALPYDLVAAAI